MAEKGGEVQLDRYRAACTYVQGDNHMGFYAAKAQLPTQSYSLWKFAT